MREEIEESDLLRFVEGDCSPDEAAAIQAWIAADPRRGELLHELRAVWRLTGSTTRRWAVAGARLRLLHGRGRHAAQWSAGFSARPGLSRSGIAAAIACVVAGTGVWLLRPRPAPVREFATPAGQRLRLTLPDSSRVLLSVGTRLRLPRDFGLRARAVELDGEAYFVVRHDPRRPFLVRTRQGVTEDLGTSFDVRAYAQEDYVQVVVASGRVALRAGRGGGDDSVLSLRSRRWDLRRGSGSGSRRCPRRPESCWASRSTARSTPPKGSSPGSSRPVSCTSTILRETRGRRRSRCRIRSTMRRSRR